VQAAPSWTAWASLATGLASVAEIEKVFGSCSIPRVTEISVQPESCLPSTLSTS
jgi:hypothetical protein